MLDLIVSVPDHCLPFYFSSKEIVGECKYKSVSFRGSSFE